VTWVNSTFYDDADEQAHVSATDPGAHYSTGLEAMIGLENATGTQATAFSSDEAIRLLDDPGNSCFFVAREQS